jgi:hypothetical protein
MRLPVSAVRHSHQKNGYHDSKINCAQNWIRTSTPFRALPPQSSASTNFATWAQKKPFFNGRQMYKCFGILTTFFLDADFLKKSLETIAG